MREIWLHFTDKDYEEFRLEAYAFDRSDNPGLCVYRYIGKAQADHLSLNWGRRKVYIECPEELVEPLQPDPGDSPEGWADEWFIPASAFGQCRILEFGPRY